jgi:hypothetical protein
MKTFFNGAPRHIALVKSGSSWWIFVNGEKLPATITVGTVFDGTAPLQIILSGVAPVGTIDDFRMTVGTARYTANMVTLDPRKFPRS